MKLRVSKKKNRLGTWSSSTQLAIQQKSSFLSATPKLKCFLPPHTLLLKGVGNLAARKEKVAKKIGVSGAIHPKIAVLDGNFLQSQDATTPSLARSTGVFVSVGGGGGGGGESRLGQSNESSTRRATQQQDSNFGTHGYNFSRLRVRFHARHIVCSNKGCQSAMT